LKKIGLTGGIGSGKTTVAKIFETLGVPVYYSDDRAKKIMEFDHDLISAITATFGEEVYVDGKLQRKVLANIVFTDPERLAELNKLVHPAVGRDFRAWCEGMSAENAYVLKEAAIIFETGGHKFLDQVLLVTCPEDLRIERVMARDGVEAQAVKDRMARQWSDADKVKLADHVIDNSPDVSLIDQVLALHKLMIEQQ
jgi:dephospho-CoA kinase